MNKNVVNGMVRLYRGSPRVREFDYDRRIYQDPDYYGAPDRGDHFLNRSDFNLFPVGKGVFVTQSPLAGTGTFGSYGNFSPMGVCPSCPSMGYLNNMGYLGADGDAPAAAAPPATVDKESGFDLVGTLESAWDWSQSEEGQDAIKKGKEIHDKVKGIGNGGSSSTSVASYKINGVAIGSIPIEDLVTKMKRIERKLVPSEYPTVGAIPKAANLIAAMTSSKPIVKMRVSWYNIIKKEIEERLSTIPAGMGSIGGTGLQMAAIATVGAIGLYLVSVAMKKRKR